MKKVFCDVKHSDDYCFMCAHGCRGALMHATCRPGEPGEQFLMSGGRDGKVRGWDPKLSWANPVLEFDLSLLAQPGTEKKVSCWVCGLWADPCAPVVSCTD